jgi:hypothetical protein
MWLIATAIGVTAIGSALSGVRSLRDE